MGRLIQKAIAGAVVASVGSAAWHLLLTDEARASVKQAGAAVSRLASHLVGVYMHEDEMPQDADAARETNREWVEWQWKQAGF